MALSIDLQTATLGIASLAAISGWATLTYQYFTDRPKVKGKILNVMRGSLPESFSQKKTALTSFVVFLYLINVRRNTTVMSRYDLYLDVGHGFEKQEIIFGVRKESKFTFLDSQGKQVEIPDFNNRLLTRRLDPLGNASPLVGLLWFGGDIRFLKTDIKKYRVVCVDMMGNSFKIDGLPKDFVPIPTLYDYYGVTVPS